MNLMDTMNQTLYLFITKGQFKENDPTEEQINAKAQELRMEIFRNRKTEYPQANKN